MKVRIITDSTADVTPDIRERLTTVPLSIFFGEEEFIDGITITHREFYEKLVSGTVLPTTSQATPEAFIKIFKEAEKAGESVVVITIASELSGTYQSAVIAAEDFPGRVFVVDSRSVTIGAGVLTELALSLKDRGMDAEGIASILKQEREKVIVLASLDTLEFLKRGGRISPTVAFAGGILSIKPLISVKEGKIEMIGKARGARQASQLLTKEIEALGGPDKEKPVLLGYTGLDEGPLKKYMEDSAALWEGVSPLRYTVVGSVVGTHAGPGAVAAAFFTK